MKVIVPLVLLLVVIAAALWITIARQRNSKKQVFVIGQQLADAVKHEQERKAHAGQAPSPLPLGKYEYQSGEFGLLKPQPTNFDHVLRQACTAFRKLSPDQRDQFRKSVSLDEFYTLLAFAQRSSVFALRSRSPEVLQDGLTALSMIELKRTDFRDVLVTTGLLYHAASRIDVDPNGALRSAAQLAESDVYELLVGFVQRSADDKDLTKSWGYCEVQTDAGAGYVEYHYGKSGPQTSLLPIAVNVAGLIDQDVYRAHSIALGEDLPEVWLKEKGTRGAIEALQHVTAGASISVSLKPDKHPHAEAQQFSVFLVELNDTRSAKALSDMALAKRPADYIMVGVAVGRFFCLIVARSFVQEVTPFESADSLERFRPAVHDILAKYAGRIGEQTDETAKEIPHD